MTTTISPTCTPKPTLKPLRRSVFGPVAYAFVAFPLAVVSPFAPGPVRSAKAWLAARLGTGTRPVAGLLGTFVAFLATLPALLFVYTAWLYPLRPHASTAIGHMFTPDVDAVGPDAWGGPTLAGAWFVHAMSALGLQLLLVWLIRAIHTRGL